MAAMNDLIDSIALAPVEARDDLISTMSRLPGWSEGKIREALRDREKTAKKKAERARKKAEREARKARFQALQKAVDNLDFSVSEEVEDFIDSVESEGGIVLLTRNESGDFALEIQGLKVRKGGTGGGRKAKDEPSGYVDSSGAQILGDLTAFARDNFTKEKLVDCGAWRPQADKLKAGKALAKALMQAGEISEDPTV